MKKNIFFKIIILLSILLQLCSLFYFINIKNKTEAIGVIFILIFSILILFFQYITNLQIKNYAVILVFILSAFHSFFGKFLHFYENVFWWDKFLHFYGTLSMSLFLICLLEKVYFLKNSSKLFIFIFTFILGGFLGQMFEVLEYGIDVFTNSKSQHGLGDTMIDIILNDVGALAAALLSLNKHFFNTR